jgi:hypothetical protein
MLNLLRMALLLLAMGAGAALAQTATTTMPSSKSTTSTSATAATPTASVSSSTKTTATRKVNTGEIYRWVDSQGRVQYGADVPEDRKATARKVDTRSNIVSSRVPASLGGAPLPAPSDAAPTPRQPITEREKCEAAWQKYNESVACFSQNRQGINGKKAGTGVSAEAQEKCQDIAQPAACR